MAVLRSLLSAPIYRPLWTALCMLTSDSVHDPWPFPCSYRPLSSSAFLLISLRRFSTFLEGYLPQAPGDFICVESGKSVGRHRGYALYTPGQRARMGGMRVPWYVVEKDAATNVVFVCEGSRHPALTTRSLITTPPSWISGAPPEQLLAAFADQTAVAAVTAGHPLRCTVRLRHPGDLHECMLDVDISEASGSLGLGALRASFGHDVHDVAPQQAIAFYDGDVCLGGAHVHRRGPSLLEQQQQQQQRAEGVGNDPAQPDRDTRPTQRVQ